MGFEDVANRMRARHQPYESVDAPVSLAVGADPISYKLALAAHHDRARRLIIIGVVWLGAGIAITAVTQSLAQEAGGGTYVFAYGPMIAGIIYLLKGLLATPPKRP
ncbi:MAG: hypothetical protein M4D80_27995 [Myxococcota bacterium]|nr:hypothetical protein [Deltaproteobacteria bacterium]MDQ3339021.1 hypothetical protein [Myxococcota bacterium]